MEQITKNDGKFYYGEKRCYGVDDAYCRFRDEYNASLGRMAWRRLSRLRPRKERVHGYGFVFDGGLPDPGINHGVVRTRYLGFVCGAYSRMLGGWDIPSGVDDDNFDEWFDWAFSSGSGALRLVKTPRNKPLNK